VDNDITNCRNSTTEERGGDAVEEFVDSHFHFWDLTNPDVEYAWLGPSTRHPVLGDIEGLKATRYGPAEYAADTRFHNVKKGVHVQVATSSDPVAETRWLQGLADSGGFPHGIVAFCDLTQANAPEVLDRHMECRNMRGIRQNVSPDTFLDPGWQKGFSLLKGRELVFCHQIGWEHVAAAVQLARLFPDTTICVDHACMPLERTAEYFTAWRDALGQLATCDNVVCKISALGMNDHRWTTESLRPWVLACIEAFGTERSFFGSNWPVDRLFSGYGDLLGAFWALIESFSTDDKKALWSTNAERVFRL
jgi:predicted TIM-barrel fold metal-dependent hydrolase